MGEVKNDGREVILKGVRLAFPNLFRTTQFEGEGDPYYAATFLIEPGSANDKAIQSAITVAANAKWEKKADAVMTTIRGQSLKFCYIDGNTKEYTGFENMWALSTKRYQTNGPPKVIDRDMTVLGPESGKPYGGCYVNAKVQIWAQDNQYGKGIRCTLMAVQFLKDGDAFGGAGPANTDGFQEESVEEDASDLV